GARRTARRPDCGPYLRKTRTVMTAPSVIVVQISDLHIKEPGRKAYRVVDTATALTECISFLNAMEPAPAVVVCTGDLVDDGNTPAAASQYQHLKKLLAA